MLRKNPEAGSPRGRRERAQAFGISDYSEARLKNVMDGERMTTDKALGQI